MEVYHSKQQWTDLLERKRSGHVFQCLYRKQRFTVKFSGSNANISYCCLLLARLCCMLNSGCDLVRTPDRDAEKSVSSRQRCGLADDVLSDRGLSLTSLLHLSEHGCAEHSAPSKRSPWFPVLYQVRYLGAVPNRSLSLF